MTALSDAIGRLVAGYYNSNPVSVANPGGLGSDGHVANFPALLVDIGLVMQEYEAINGNDLNALAAALAQKTLSNVTNADFLAKALAAGALAAPSRSLAINGACEIDQRNAGGAVTLASGSDVFGPDRWKGRRAASGGTATIQQSTGGPDPSLPLVCLYKTTAAVAVAAGDRAYVEYDLEGIDIGAAQFGAAGASRVQVGFAFYAGATGTYSVAFQNSARTRSYVVTFNVPTVNARTWVTVDLPPDVAGTWLKDTGVGMRMVWDAGSGSTFEAAAGAWQAGDFTRAAGVIKTTATLNAQICVSELTVRVGTVLGSYERVQISEQLLRCQRYWATLRFDWAWGASGNFQNQFPYQLPTAMRATPSAAIASFTSSSNLSSSGVGATSPQSLLVTLTSTAAGSTGMAGAICTFNAELA